MMEEHIHMSLPTHTTNTTMDFNFNMINFELHKEDEITGKQFIEVLRCSDTSAVDGIGDFGDPNHLGNGCYEMPNHRYPNTFYDSSGGGGYGHNDLSPTSVSGSEISYFSSHSPFSPNNSSTDMVNLTTQVSTAEHTFNPVNTIVGNCGTPLTGKTSNNSQTQPTPRKKGGRKKNLRPPSPTVMKHRREAANARERKRMNGLNDAFERLREVNSLKLYFKII